MAAIPHRWQGQIQKISVTLLFPLESPLRIDLLRENLMIIIIIIKVITTTTTTTIIIVIIIIIIIIIIITIKHFLKTGRLKIALITNVIYNCRILIVITTVY